MISILFYEIKSSCFNILIDTTKMSFLEVRKNYGVNKEDIILRDLTVKTEKYNLPVILVDGKTIYINLEEYEYIFKYLPDSEFKVDDDYETWQWIDAYVTEITKIKSLAMIPEKEELHICEIVMLINECIHDFELDLDAYNDLLKFNQEDSETYYVKDLMEQLKDTIYIDRVQSYPILSINIWKYAPSFPKILKCVINLGMNEELLKYEILPFMYEVINEGIPYDWYHLLDDETALFIVRTYANDIKDYFHNQAIKTLICEYDLFQDVYFMMCDIRN